MDDLVSAPWFVIDPLIHTLLSNDETRLKSSLVDRDAVFHASAINRSPFYSRGYVVSLQSSALRIAEYWVVPNAIAESPAVMY